MNDNQQENQNNSGKEAKKFEANFKKLVALFGGMEIFKKNKLVSEEISTVVGELVKEEKEALIVTFKTKAKALINRKQEFDKFLKAETEKVKKATEEKQKEFNKEMEGLYAIVDKIEGIEKSYYQTLGALSNDTDTPSVEEEAGDGMVAE